VIAASAVHPSLEVGVIATGAHLAPGFGHTLRQIEQDGFPIVERIESLLDSDRAFGRARSAAVQLLGLTQTLEREAPDFLVVCGDREESITGALAGAYGNVPVAQIAAGDLAVGNVDDSVRHAVTKLAHLHLTLSEASAVRVRRLGEEVWRVHNVGNPALDRLTGAPALDRKELSRRLGCDLTRGPVVLVIQHVISSEIEQGAAQLRTTLEAAQELGFTTLVGSPNSDAGSRAMREVIREFAAASPAIHAYETLPREVFGSLLRSVDVLLGNSSAGLLEAPFLSLPVVNVGNRQRAREHAENVLFVAHERGAIVEAVKRCLFDEAHRAKVAATSNPYGDGRSGERIASILARAPSRDRLLEKHWTY
jgi:GDP/UDP-N,N'-diacetylbacillosamine 2-epimerase (hydrolysing)